MIIYRLKTISKKYYKNEIGFLLVFVIALIADVSMKFNLDTRLFRYFTKPIGSALLLGYLYVNSTQLTKQRLKLILAAIVLFLIGDIIFINRENFISFNVAISFLILAKICFIRCFNNQNDFNVSRLFPFLAISFIYLSTILYFIFDNLAQNYLIQVIFYFFIALLLALFAFLRRGAVNKLSYRLVYFGVLISFISDGFSALNLFSDEFHYNNATSTIITLAYGVSQYLIVSGLLNESSEE